METKEESSGKIAMILDGYYPEDIRVSKELKSLLGSGFRVFLICARSKNEATRVRNGELVILRVNRGTRKFIYSLFNALNAIMWTSSTLKMRYIAKII